jgi:hypothetical protein
MKASTPLLLVVGLVTLLAAPFPAARAQTTQPPSATPPRDSAQTPDLPRLDFSGVWTMDRTYSNDPAQANFDAGQAATQSRRGGMSSGFGGLQLPGMGRGGNRSGGNSGGNRSDAASGTTADEKSRLAALTDELKKASTTLTISHHDPSFVVTNGLEHATFSHTTGQLEDQQLGELTIPTVTRWDGDRIVTEFDLSSRRRLTYTYTLLQNTRQLVLRVRLDSDQGPRANGSELKLVYRQAPGSAAK